MFPIAVVVIFNLLCDVCIAVFLLAIRVRVALRCRCLPRCVQNLSKELINEVVSDLREMIQLKAEQVHLVDSCSVNVIDLSR